LRHFGHRFMAFIRRSPRTLIWSGTICREITCLELHTQQQHQSKQLLIKQWQANVELIVARCRQIILKHSSFPEGRVHTTPEGFENGALFLRPSVHTNPPRKRSFSKTLFKPEEFENAGFAFWCGRKTF